MAIVRTKIVASQNLAPGAEKHWLWNNAHYGPSYFLDVQPLDNGTSQTGFNHTTQLEIPRQWRKFITKEVPGTIGVTVDHELELHYIVKNVGTEPATYNVWLVEVS